ncbi:MAG: N-acetyltransferase [Candidatus Marinimicrobia bacterium]|jgi:diamine N-acetyltransferase|nr:N-acetyltransferase [Candidatus Neomarinimicrobiota bacterium]MDP7036975.1 N-acetyltransferase [Candidatus Neomarinimicrobiota bacterium]|tara:strand:+ start:379 stop:864 length:486 start_codon:yes stop_codon:yes gene_type:complete
MAFTAMTMSLEYIFVTPDHTHLLETEFIDKDQVGFADEPIETIVECQKYQSSVPRAAFKNGELVAFWVHEEISESPCTYLIWDFVVHRAFQGQGIGKKILKDEISYLHKTYKAVLIVVSVIPSNTIATSLYLNLGFVDTGKINNDGEKVLHLDLSCPKPNA